MKTVISFFLVLSVLLSSCSTENEHVYVHNGKMSNLIEIGGKWTEKENTLSSVGPRTFVVTKDLIPGGAFTIEAKVSLDTINGTNASFMLWGNYFNFDGTVKDRKVPAIMLSGELFKEPVVIDDASNLIKGRTSFKFQVKGNQQAIKFYINGKELHSCPNTPNAIGNAGFRAGNGGLNIYDFKVISVVQPQKELTYLFKSGDDGYNTFRIPAMVVTNNGTVLAFAEGRRNTSSDTGDIDIVLKRSTNAGKTWSSTQVVWDDQENTCGNPAPVVDRETGTIFLFSTRNLGTDREPQIIDQTSKDTRRIFVTQSSDDGVTWTAPVEITKDVKNDNWTWYATGPCQGIQIVHGKYKGRLVIPCDHIESGTNKYFSHAIYSDDHGKTWKLGGTTPVDQVNECTVAEIADGKLLLNMRNYDRTQKSRKTSVSDDGGITWSDFKSDEMLVEPICQAGMYRYSFEQDDKSRLLFTNPANPDKRCNMTLRLSYDDGANWAKSMVLYPGPAAYSDVTKLPNGNVGCFYEAGYVHPYEGIVFEEIQISNLEK